MANIDEIYNWFFQYFRPRRLKTFRDMFPEVMTDVNILDVGGSTYQWDYLRSPASVTILNTSFDASTKANNKYVFARGDGRNLGYRDKSYDLVFSNSVIEHVGDSNDQLAFANEMRRVGKKIYCQTPNKWFFVEPHLITIFIHWLPLALQRRLIRWCSVWGWVTKPSRQKIDKFLESTRLLSYNELERLFPDCKIIRERFLGLTKSLIVIRNN